MTSSVLSVLDKIKDSKIFEDELYFTGGTALAYYIDHRISEDIDIISPSSLNHRNILLSMKSLGAVNIQDDKTFALRLAGLFPQEYILKFILDDVKLEFFQANRPIQQKILKEATYSFYKDSSLKILDIKSVAKLKLVALQGREKARDLFDFGAILENKVLSKKEILEITSFSKEIKSIDKLYQSIKAKKEPKDDEAVYLNEDDPKSIDFESIKSNVLGMFDSF